jgi:hypothetical protein
VIREKHNSEEITIFFAGRDIFRKSAPASPDEAVKTEDAGVENAEAGQAETPAASTSESTELLGARGKELAAFSPFGTVLPAYKKRSLFRSTSGLAPAYYYTQIELSVGLFGGLRIGLNPGELIDALAGIFTFDPFSDDEPFLTAEQRALEENPVYRDLSDEQKRLFREQLSKQAPDRVRQRCFSPGAQIHACQSKVTSGLCRDCTRRISQPDPLPSCRE